MNKNIFMSPLRGLALASVAVAVLSSCAKDEVTERSALSLELEKLRAQRQVDSLGRAQQRIYDVNSLRYQRALDSLDRINAGGRVFYSVAVVSGSSTAFSTGRSEEAEGVAGATVSISQYGTVTTVTTPASGLATAELRSGAAAVVISAPNHTTVNYVVNLTPDGSSQIGTPANITRNAPGNGTTVYVSNVMPLFQTGGANAATAMATIRGLALIETNLTNDVAEAVTPALLGTGSNLLTANINVNPAFMTRYINNRLNNSSIPSTGSGWEGDVQKVAYESATSVATLDATGAYSVLVPATASGLPIRLKYSDIATTRTFWAEVFDGQGTAGAPLGVITNRRFIYGQNAQALGAANVGTVGGNAVFATGIRTTGGTADATLSFSTNRINATGTVTATTSAGRLSVEQVTLANQNLWFGVNVGGDANFFVFDDGAMGAARYAPASGGEYLSDISFEGEQTLISAPVLPPTVVIGAPPAGGTQATGTAIARPIASATSGNLRRIVAVRANAAGVGYTGRVGVAFTRRDGTGVTGTGLVLNPTSGIGFIRVVNGSTGYVNELAVAGTTTTSGAWTGLFPQLVLGAATPVDNRFDVVIPQANFQVNQTANVGTIQRITATGIQFLVNGGGAPSAFRPSQAQLDEATFRYFTSRASIQRLDAQNDPLFEVANVIGGAGELRFNTNGAGGYVPVAPQDGQYGNATVATSLDLTTILPLNLVNGGSGYVFAPSARFTGNLPAGATYRGTPTLTVTTTRVSAVDARVSSVTLGGDVIINGVAAAVGCPDLAIEFVDPQPAAPLVVSAISAAGGIINNYAFAPASLGTQNVVRNIATARPIPFLVAAAQFNSYYARFSRPANPSGSPALGVPVLDNANRIIGLEIIDPGNGYTAAEAISFTIVPTPVATVTPGDVSLGRGFAADAAGEIRFIGGTTSLNLRVTNPGADYAQVPDIFFVGGGITLNAQPDVFEELNPLINADSTVQWGTGLINAPAGTMPNLAVFINNAGQITRLVYRGTRVGNAPVAAFPWRSLNDIGIIISSEENDRRLAVAYNTLSVGNVVNRLGAGSTNPLAVGRYWITPVSHTGGVLNPIRMNRVRTAATPTAAAVGDTVRWFEANVPPGGPEEDYFSRAIFIRPPSVTVTSGLAGATGARYEFVLGISGSGNDGAGGTVGGINANGAKIRALNRISGGTGYATPVVTTPTNGQTIATGGRFFTVFGQGFTFTQDQIADGLSQGLAFEAFSGITYIRDIHYGTGEYVNN